LGKTVTLTASDGKKISAYQAEPKGKPRGGIVVIQEIFGVNSHIQSVADGFAKDGYLAIAPALFDRVQRGFDVGYSPEDMTRGREVRAKVSNEDALKDTAAAIKAVAGAGKVGIVGYCWGGTIAWLAAGKLAGIAAAVPYYGGGILADAALQPRVPVMGHFGERDAHIPVDGVKKLAAQHPKHQIFLYAADHGFNCDQRGSYDAPAAKQARERTLAFLRQHVG
jgi:carboxymethylenebutenolidase